MDNAARLHEITTTLRDISQDSTTCIIKVSFFGASSPDGTYEINRKMAQERLSSLEEFVRQQVDLPDSIIFRDDSYIPWGDLKSQIAQSDLRYKEEAIAIIEEEEQLVDYSQWSRIDSRVFKLQKLDGGKLWQEIKERYFSSLRNASVIVVTVKEEIPSVEETQADSVQVKMAELSPYPATTTGPAEEPAEDQAAEAAGSGKGKWNRHLHIKTNAVGWGLAVANLGVEIDLGRHWSFNLPFYYSAWDYFKSTIKFRVTAFQPEFRYWFSVKRHCNDGWFAGTHFGFAQYNLAVDGDYRYQHHNPALGGGLSLGYRCRISKNNRWRLELSLGGGAYSLNFDKFHNYSNGLQVSNEQKTYWGFDQASVSFSYSFDLKKNRGG